MKKIYVKPTCVVTDTKAECMICVVSLGSAEVPNSISLSEAEVVNSGTADARGRDADIWEDGLW